MVLAHDALTSPAHASWWCGARMMAIRAKTLRKNPAANQANTGAPRYPFFIERIAHAIEHRMLTTSTNIQLAGSINVMATTDLGLIKECANLWKNREFDHNAALKFSPCIRSVATDIGPNT